jgi:hypothetical protein
MADQINGNHQIIAGKYYDADPPVPVATGNVFTDVGLHPGEKIVRTFVFYVPQGVYDFVEVEVRLPTTTTEIPGHPGEPIAGVEYKVRADHAGYSSSVYRIGSNGAHEQPKDADAGDLDVQWAISTRMLSLWQTAPSSAVADRP